MNTTTTTSHIAVLLILLLIGTNLFADPTPDLAARTLGANDTQTYRLYQRLVGSSWSYTYRGRVYRDLMFAQGGLIVFPAWKEGATWRILNANSIAIRHPKLGEMPVHFSAEFKKFTAKDWGGGNAIGTLQDPTAKVDQ